MNKPGELSEKEKLNFDLVGYLQPQSKIRKDNSKKEDKKNENNH
jgi:hypothetical protein